MRYGNHSIGPFEEILLQAALVRASGPVILQKADRIIGRPVKADAMYHALSRLQAKGYIASDGRRLRDYWTTDAGKEALEEVRRSREAVSRTDGEAE